MRLEGWLNIGLHIVCKWKTAIIAHMNLKLKNLVSKNFALNIINFSVQAGPLMLMSRDESFPYYHWDYKIISMKFLYGTIIQQSKPHELLFSLHLTSLFVHYSLDEKKFGFFFLSFSHLKSSFVFWADTLTWRFSHLLWKLLTTKCYCFTL